MSSNSETWKELVAHSKVFSDAKRSRTGFVIRSFLKSAFGITQGQLSLPAVTSPLCMIELLAILPLGYKRKQ